jgi:hypothetical protein
MATAWSKVYATTALTFNMDTPIVSTATATAKKSDIDKAFDVLGHHIDEGQLDDLRGWFNHYLLVNGKEVARLANIFTASAEKDNIAKIARLQSELAAATAAAAAFQKVV